MKKIRSLNLIKKLFFFGTFLGVVSLGHFLLNKAAEENYELRKEEIEEKIGNFLNKKVELGDFIGIRFFGISIADTKIIDSENIDSQIKANNVFVGIMPIKSILNQKWIINVKPNKAKISIDNDFFKIEESSTKEREFSNNQIKYDLNFNLAELSNLYLNDLGIESKIKGKIVYRTDNKQIIGNINANFKERGNLKFKINTSLKQDSLSLEIFSNEINLRGSSFNIFNRKFNVSEGKIKSDFKFYKSSEQTFCKGGFSLNKLKINTSSLSEDAKTDSLRFLCEKNSILAKTNDFNYGTLISDLIINIPLNKDINNINLKGSIGYIDSLNPEIQLSGNIPYWFDKRRIKFGDIYSSFSLNRTQLSNLNIFRSNEIRGFITAEGELKGNINDPNILINFNVDYPHYRGIRIREIWDGEINNNNNQYSINLNNRYSPIPSFLSLNFDSNLQLKNLIFSRIFNSNKGTLNLFKSSDNYIWEANNFPLDELELSLNSNKFDRISGNINGSGFISTDQSNFDGRIAWSLGKYRNIKFANSLVDFTLNEKNMYINSSLYPIDGGMIDILYDSNNDTLFKINFNNISIKWSLLTAIDIFKFDNKNVIPKGNSSVLDNIKITSEGKNFKDQIAFINDFIDNNVIKDEKIDIKKYLSKFESRYNGNLNIEVKDQSIYKFNASLDAYIDVINNYSNSRSKEDFSLEMEGGLFEGKGLLKISQLPLQTINIFLNQPKDFDGSLDINLNYDLDNKFFKSNISSNNTSIKDYLLTLDKGKIEFNNSLFDLDLSLLLNNSNTPINLTGYIPINNKNNLDLRIYGNGQFIDLIDILVEDNFTFNKGNVNFRMIIKGSLNKPISNGFLVINDSEVDIYKNTVKDINSTIIFDFDQIEIKQFKARRKDSGMIFLSGSLPFYDKSNLQNKSINLETSDFKIETNNLNFILDSNLNISGSLENLFLGGEAVLKNGFINFNNKKNNAIINISKDSDNKRNWPELDWEKDKTIEVISNESILNSNLFRDNLPKYLKNLSLNNLILKLGPDFIVQYSDIIRANLDTKLDLVLNGKIRKDLQARGLINLSRGRANLYTTPFNLDRNKENYILFAPRSGIVPFISFYLISKVPDSIIPIKENNQDLNISSGLNANSSSSGFGAFGIGNTRLIRIEASYQGFLDQLSFEDENKRIQLRSVPSYSRSQIIGLIGGNSANLINRAFISQLNGSNAFNERLQLSLYPALIENNEQINNVYSNDNLDIDGDDQTSSSDGLSSQAWIAQIGLDITDRINFAVQVTPDRDDLPPLGILTLQANPNLEFLGSFDSNGDWKSQVQLFFRY